MVVRRKPKPLFFILITLIILGLILISIGGTLIYLSAPVDKNSDKSVEIVIPQGTSTKKIATILKENNLIKSELFFSLYTRFYSTKTLKASNYNFSQSMSLKDIVKSLEEGNTYDPNVVVITFKEGERLKNYVNEISNKTNYNEEEIIDVLNDKNYISELINQYWFLTNSILNTSIYYPLEGYLAPDTYFFKKDVTIQGIIKKLLDEEEKKLEQYKQYLNENNIHDVITMASIVEIEGTNSDNRKEIVGVFNNRLKSGMNLGSDVTSYYALQLPLTQDLNSEQLSVINPYNTRAINMGGKMPVGPICNPSISSIEASIYPNNNDYFYFVADKKGIIYYAKTLEEHQKNIRLIKEKGDWIW